MMNKKLNKYCVLVLLLSVGAIFQVCADSGPGVRVDFDVEVPVSSCKVKVLEGNIYDLGEIERKRQEHQAFSIKVDCDGETKTRIKASAIDGVISGNGAYVSVGMGNGDAVSASGFRFPRLRLQADGRFVKVRGSDDDWFCTAGTPGRSHICNITPVTVAKPETLPGKGSATIAFTIDYFL
ncbi:TPA: hypothetical protein ACP2HE_004542 [Escherichia coli]